MDIIIKRQFTKEDILCDAISGIGKRKRYAFFIFLKTWIRDIQKNSPFSTKKFLFCFHGGDDYKKHYLLFLSKNEKVQQDGEQLTCFS